ncbi:MAG: aspartate 1-decarboxylase [Bacteroidales bacterium]|nr:aspartate 1-decarboxylase [Bacteroidales bacterium]
MNVKLLKSKIHRATVTRSDLHYVGSIGIDEDLMDQAKLFNWEKVHVFNINNGERFETYVIREERGSGIVGIYGAAARKVAIGDLIIVAAYASMTPEEAKNFQPAIAIPDASNHIK